ncbi:hypothetical protein [Spiroplasma endosymbiont of Glossina fuscipes fuscipes]|uniref:hypothetical protein n=1 Tax=Spiroplasma endosymbiont of Glossina fuscipes fuscipes TaxID=2004463 RepID=UPI003C744148
MKKLIKIWVSPLIEIESAIEEIGGAHIDGHISAQVIFSHSSINHLILTLIIYVGGQCWLTGNWPHIWFMTGQILSFYKK